MARDYQTTVDLLIQRVRQTGGIAVTQNFATEVLGKCERLLNAYLRRVVASNSFTTTAQQLVYAYRSTLTDAIDILDVSESTRPLLRVDNLTELSAYDIDWFRKTDGTRFEVYAQIARDYLIIYPAKASNSSVTVTYTKLVTAYTTYAGASGNNMSLSDEDVETALKLAEVILLMGIRDIKQTIIHLKQLIPLLALHTSTILKEIE